LPIRNPCRLFPRALVLWAVFFVTAFSLGYPTLNRYNPATTGLADTQYYVAMVEKDIRDVGGSHWRYRVMVPLLAKPVYWAAQGHIGSWHPGFFALLVVNAAFAASTALLLAFLGRRLLGDIRIGLLAAFLFLSNFNLSNLYLSGLVDSAEVFFLVVLAWLLFDHRWWSVAGLGILGALARETFVPYSCALFGGWFLAERWYRNHGPAPYFSGCGLAVLGLATVILVRFVIAGTAEMPWHTASSEIPDLSRMLTGIPAQLSNRNMIYTFAVIGPLGLLGLGTLPRSWVVGSGFAFLVALLLGAGAGADNNIGRPLFNAAGPLLVVAAAGFLWRLLGKRDG
jgi:hypothetical protein